MKKIIQKIFNLLGYKVLKIDSDHIKPNNFFFPEASEFDLNLIKKVKDFTLTDYQSIFYLIQTIKHVKRKNVLGDFVECGFWRFCKQAVDEFFENSNETFFQINKSRVILK